MRNTVNFNGNWKYYQGFDNAAHLYDFDDSSWKWINLPHNTSLYTAENKNGYQGLSCYRKKFTVDDENAGKRFLLCFEGIMQHCRVHLNGKLTAEHHNGYTPFTVDISDKVIIGSDNLISVITDSRPAPEYTPGKQNPDFQYFGGIYRNVTLNITDEIYIGNAIEDGITAGGGIFLTSPFVSRESADIRTKAYVHNDSSNAQEITLQTEIIYNSAVVADGKSTAFVEAHSAYTFDELLSVSAPKLWHPYSPELYTIKCTVMAQNQITDTVETAYGIRSAEWTHNGLFINGEKFTAQGANLHSDIFVLGNAIPDNEVYEEIKRLKENGFDFIRMAHYPHSPAYYAACDKYGVLVLDCMSGWQYFSNSDTFKESTYNELRTMIRNSRNHPCIIAWETSLNESNFTEEWAENVQRIANEEYPAEGVSRIHTAGWLTDVFDIHLSAAQHDVRNRGDSYDKGIIISEYGDWDYGGTSSTSRQPRGYINGMLTQAANHIESSILNRDKPWFAADGLWSYNDYAGFDSAITACGVTDIYRLDKYTAHFFRSQRDADVDLTAYGLNSGATVFTANSLEDNSPADVTVFSNCDEVELLADGVSLGKRKPDSKFYGNNSGKMLSTESLPHPPITFAGANNGASELKAIGFINGNAVCEHTVKAPATAEKTVLTAESKSPIDANGSDLRLIWVRITDKNGTVIAKDSRSVSFAAENGYIIGLEQVNTVNGQIAVWVRATPSETDGKVVITATADGLSDGVLEIPFTGCKYAADCNKAVNEYAGCSYAENRGALSDRAREMPAYASSCADGCTAEYGNNGEPSTFWYPSATDENVWWYVDTGAVYDFKRIEICWNNSRAHRFVISLSEDGENWTEVLDNSDNTENESQSTEAISGRGRFVRISFAENCGQGFNMFYAYGI